MNWKRLLSLLVCTAMMLSLVPAGVLSLSAAETAVDTSKLTVYGRTYEKDDVLYLYWVNSGFSFRFNGTGATATLTGSNTAQIYRGYVNVYVDGEFEPSKTICLENATGVYTLAEGLPAGEHTIEVRKRNEGGYGGTAIIGVKTLTVTGGDFLTPPAAPTRQIEFVGDSITTGFGNIGGPNDGYSTAVSDGSLTYAVLAAKQLDAEAQVLSRSGIHYCHSAKSDGTYVDSFYDHYANTATLPNVTGDNTAWDFANNPSDVVVINLGTNDVGAQRTTAVYTADAVDFINLVRAKNPDAIIIWTYGMMGNSIQPALEAAVKQVNDAGDDKVFYLPLANYVTTTEGVAVGHPTVQTDINRSLVLAKFIAEKTGWTLDNKAMLEAQLQWSAQYNTEAYLADYTALTAKKFTEAYAAGKALLGDTAATNADYVAAAEAVWMAKVDLVSADDMSAEYIVIDPCDTTSGVGFAGSGSLDVDDYKEGVASLTTTGSSGTIAINHQNTYNVTLPEDWQEWYIEAWLYVSDPTAIPNGSCLEVSQAVDSVEVAWALNSLGLQAGWNKLQLKITSANGKDRLDEFTAIKNIRLFVVNLTKELTIKIDNIVLSKGKAAANIDAWETALAAAEALLAEEENADVRAAYEQAKTAVSQADVDAFTKALNAAVEEASNKSVDSIAVGKNLEWVTTYGRTYAKANGVLYLYWTNSGLSFRFNGTGASIEMLTDNLNMFGYLNVYVDGEFAPSRTIKVDKASGTYVLAENLPLGEHTIELRKRNEAVYGGSATLGIKTLTIADGGLLEPPAAPARQIEFIGDSITSGFGNLVTDGSGDYTSDTVEGTMTYAVLAAKQLGANAQVLSRSGIHYCYSKNDVDTFYGNYQKTASIPGGAGLNAAWDFEANPSDVVVINLGTNDAGKGRDKAIYTDDAVDFIKMVRECNPDAVIIWTYGLMGNSIQPALEAAVKQVNDAGDDKVFYLPLENYISTTEGQGTHGHPSIQTNINRSLVLANFIAEKTGWEVDSRAMLQAQLQWSSQYTTEEYLKDYTEVTTDKLLAAMEDGEKLLANEDAKSNDFAAAADAIWKAYLGLISLDDVSAEYIVIDTMDAKNGWNLGGNPNGVDSTDFKAGSGCLYTTWTGETMIHINSTGAKGIALPEDWEDWYLEAWIYVDNPENIPSGSCLEIAQTMDQVEIQWGLDSLGLKSGWNKVQLSMTSGSRTRPENFKTINSVRTFVVNVTAPLTLKIDHVVLARGKAAANIDDWKATLAAAEEKLANNANEQLLAMYELACTAQTQADVDAFTARLKAAMGKFGDVNDDGKVNTTDARTILQYAANLIGEDDLNLAAADVNGDGKVNTTDARVILQYAANLIDKFPAEG